MLFYSTVLLQYYVHIPHTQSSQVCYARGFAHSCVLSTRGAIFPSSSSYSTVSGVYVTAQGWPEGISPHKRHLFVYNKETNSLFVRYRIKRVLLVTPVVFLIFASFVEEGGGGLNSRG